MTKKRWVVFGIIAAIILTGAGIAVYLLTRSDTAIPLTDGSIPTFTILTPNGKSLEAQGGLNRISPPESDPVYAYTDTIGDVSISVSQQQLPSSFKSALDESIESLAKQYNASKKIDAKGVSVFIGTSTKGPQSLIFTKNELLILIKSQKEISDADWIQYIASLRKP